MGNGGPVGFMTALILTRLFDLILVTRVAGYVIDFATLTGAARVALGVEVG